LSLIPTKGGLIYGGRNKMRFNQGKAGTKTSAFGSPGRINHDSTAFYTSKLYEGLPKEEIIEYAENPVPSNFLDKIFCKTSEKWRNCQIIASI